MHTYCRASIALALLLSAGVAAAQPADATQFQQTSTDERPDDDTTNWALNAGGVFNSGNTRSYTLNAGTNFGIIRGRHGFALEWTFNYGRADVPADDSDDLQQTVRNSNARVRYDLYLTRMDALFVALSHRWDTFAGLDTRLQGQAGYLRNFLREEKHRIWGEVGYDITWDDFDPDPLPNPDPADPMLCEMTPSDPSCILDNNQVVHAGRLYLGYDNQLHENVRVTAGLEALLNLQEPEDLRLNFDAALRSTIAGSLQLEVRLKMLFDNVPVPGKEKLDTITTLSLIYTLISDDDE